MDPISLIRPASAISGAIVPDGEKVTLPTSTQGSAFNDLLGKLVSEVNDKQVAAGGAVNGLLAGDNVSLHQAMIAVQEAGISFQLMVELRNKVLDSYHEIMRMQV